MIVVRRPAATDDASLHLLSKHSAAIDAGVAGAIMEDDSVAPIPNPSVQQQLFVVMRAASTDAARAEALAALLQQIEADGTWND